MIYQHLVKFLADHFGGYESAEEAMKGYGFTSLEQYQADFTWPLDDSPYKEKLLAEADSFLAPYNAPGGFDKLREMYFDDAGNIEDNTSDCPPTPFALRTIISHNN